MNATDLKTAMREGSLELDKATVFWPSIDPEYLVCSGQRRVIGSGVVVQPVKLTKHALLVSLQTFKGETLYSWVHSDY